MNKKILKMVIPAIIGASIVGGYIPNKLEIEVRNKNKREYSKPELKKEVSCELILPKQEIKLDKDGLAYIEVKRPEDILVPRILSHEALHYLPEMDGVTLFEENMYESSYNILKDSDLVKNYKF